MTASAKRVSTTSQVTTGPTQLQMITNGATAGVLTLKNGDSGGTTKVIVPLAANQSIVLPTDMPFPDGLYASLSTINDVVFWFA